MRLAWAERLIIGEGADCVSIQGRHGLSALSRKSGLLPQSAQRNNLKELTWFQATNKKRASLMAAKAFCSAIGSFVVDATVAADAQTTPRRVGARASKTRRLWM